MKCKVLYVGQTARRLKDRLKYNQRSDIVLRKDTAVAKHFNEPKHDVKDLRIMPIASIENMPFDTRLHTEKRYMTLLNTIYPRGLNFYPLV